MTASKLIRHHGVWVRPAKHDGCLCGMADAETGVTEGGDCRSLGCDPCCGPCGGGPDDECPNPLGCGGRKGKKADEDPEGVWDMLPDEGCPFSAYEQGEVSDGAW